MLNKRAPHDQQVDPDDLAHGIDGEAVRLSDEEGESAGSAAQHEIPQILLAADSVETRAYISRLLRPNCKVRTVADIEAAIAAVRERRPDLVLADTTPSLDGSALLRAIKADPALRDLPVVMLAARADAESSAEALGAGADDYVAAPFSARELLARVNRSLDLARLRRESSSALRENERRLRTLLMATSDVVYRMSPDWREMRRLFGRNFIPDTEKPSRDWLRRYIHPEDRHRVMRAIAEAVLTKSTFELEHRVIRANGAIGWTVSRAVPLLNADGEITEWIGAAADVTERKRAEDALRQRTAQFETLFDEAPLGIYLVDAKLRLRQLNPVARAIFASVPNPLGADFVEAINTLWPKSDADEIVAGFRQALKTGQPYSVSEFTGARRDTGAIESYEWQASRIPLPDGGYGVVCYFRDISAHVRARMAVAESEELFRTLAESIPQLAWMTRPDGWILWYNRRWYEYTGTTPEEMQGWGWRKVHHPDHVDRVVERWSHALECGQPWEDTFPLRARDGSYRWFLSRALPIRDAAGRVVRWFGTNTDITDQRDAQEALREADRRKDEFLAMLAHELRNPLAAIANASEMLARIPPAEPHARDIIPMLKRQVGQLARLADDLLDVARITQGRIELRQVKVDLASVITQAVESVQPLVRQRGHRLLVESPNPSLSVRGDPARLAQCVANVLNNAAKYTPDGGQILLRAGEEGGCAKIEIEDNGVGIPAEILPHVFDLFVQGDRSLDRSEGGLGIGLSLVKRLVQMHGGSVEAASAGPGCGATFTLRLPLAEPASGQGSETAAEAKPRRVLIVDDNRDGADSFAMLLELDRHEVKTVYSASAALDIAPAFRPEVVFLDIGLPQMDGYEVARRLRQMPELSATRLIALTGYGQAEDKRRAREAGFDGHLVKPVDLGQIKRTLAEGRVSARP